MSHRLCRPPRRCVRTMNERVNEYNLRQRPSPSPHAFFPFRFIPLQDPSSPACSTLASHAILQSWRMLLPSSHPDFAQALRKHLLTFPSFLKKPSIETLLFDSSDNFEIIIFHELRKRIYIYIYIV